MEFIVIHCTAIAKMNVFHSALKVHYPVDNLVLFIKKKLMMSIQCIENKIK